MLRFTHSLELTLRQKESRFSSDFWKGLGCAVTFHVLLFVIFRIAAMPNFDTISPLRPVHVEIDLGRRDTSVTLSPIQSIPFAWDTIDSSLLEASLNALIAFSFKETDALPYTQKRERSRPDFSELERIEYTPLERLP